MEYRRFRPVFLLFLFNSFYLASSETYLSNFKFEIPVIGYESLIKDFVSLNNDPKANLPDSFTVCSSVFIKFWRTDISIIEMLKEDGSHWFHMNLRTAQRNYKTMTEWLTLFYENPANGDIEMEDFTNIVPIVPHSWYHICLGIDSVSGLLRVVVNGLEVVNMEKDYFKDTRAWKPSSLEGKIVQLKGFWGGFWYQYRNIFSNMNIFGSMMSVDDMVSRTAGGGGCSSPGDYLRSFSNRANFFLLFFDSISSYQIIAHGTYCTMP